MATYDDYPHLTKIDKSRFNSIKKAIFDVSRKLGSGASSPVPYDTAWVARIPDMNKPSPAFPESLQWLRDHQAEDGSWGTEYPFSTHSKVLNTFAAVLAFSQWNLKNDADRIQRGIKAVEMIGKSLPQEETDEKAFEMIMSSILEDAREFKLDLEYEKFEWCSKIGKEKLKTIEREILSNKPNKYWPLLEAAGSMDLELESYRSQIIRYGLIAAQPSTTAFFLRYARLRGDDFPEAEWTLKNLSTQNQGGIPHIVPVDNFEIIYGLDLLFKVGINPRINVKYAATQGAIDTLIGRLDSSGGVGFSSNWLVVDSECTATALGILRQTSSKRQDHGSKAETKTHRNEVTKVHPACRDGFRLMTSDNSSKQQEMSQNKKRSDFSKDLKFTSKLIVGGTRNISSYYALLQHVFGTTKHAIEALTEIERFIGKSQNSDGGWGDKIPSSAEETAYVCLTIFCLIQTRKEILDNINFPKLVQFMNNVDTLPKIEPFWCYKVIFGSNMLTKASITAAKYAIFQIQRLCMFTDALNDNQLDFLEIACWNEKGQYMKKQTFPLKNTKVRQEDIEVSKTEIEDICKTVFQTEHLDAYTQKIIDLSVHFSYTFNAYKMSPYDRTMEVLLVTVLYFLDDLIDYVPQGKEPPAEFGESMKILSDIVRGHYQNFETLPTLDLNRIESIWRYFFHRRQWIEKLNGDPESFANVLDGSVIKGLSHGCKLRCLGIQPTSKAYLKIAKLDIAVMDFVHCSALLQDNTIDSTEFENDGLFLKYRDCARKAARILFDVPSIFKDIHLSQSDNYIVPLLQEYDISLSEAMAKATKKASKEVMKMYSLKRMIVARKNKDNEKLEILTRTMACYASACGVWAQSTPRYQVGQKSFFKNVSHESKDLKFTWDLCFNQNENTDKEFERGF